MIYCLSIFSRNKQIINLYLFKYLIITALCIICIIQKKYFSIIYNLSIHTSYIMQIAGYPPAINTPFNVDVTILNTRVEFNFCYAFLRYYCKTVYINYYHIFLVRIYYYKFRTTKLWKKFIYLWYHCFFFSIRIK